MEEGTIVAWPLEVGSPVKRGEIVLIIETEKAESEIEATSDGVIRHVYVDVDYRPVRGLRRMEFAGGSQSLPATQVRYRFVDEQG